MQSQKWHISHTEMNNVGYRSSNILLHLLLIIAVHIVNIVGFNSPFTSLPYGLAWLACSIDCSPHVCLFPLIHVFVQFHFIIHLPTIFVPYFFCVCCDGIEAAWTNGNACHKASEATITARNTTTTTSNNNNNSTQLKKKPPRKCLVFTFWMNGSSFVVHYYYFLWIFYSHPFSP